MTEKLRILVMTSASGGGHDSQAKAFADWVEIVYGERVEVRIEHVFEDSSRFQRACVECYNTLQRRAPWGHHLFYQWTEVLGYVNTDRVTLGRDYFRELLKEWKPDVVLSVHDCLNRGYFGEVKEVLGDRVRCVTYCPEFDSGYGFSRGWVNPGADLFIGRTAELAVDAVRHGLPADRFFVGGNLIGPRFFDAAVAEGAAGWLREITGFDPSRFTLLLATGGAGAQNHRTVLDRLAGAEIQVIALYGHDRRVRVELERWGSAHPWPKLYAMPFTDRMPELLMASSLVYTRPGSTAAEALQCGCPIVFNTSGTAMPHELPTLRWFRRNGIHCCASGGNQLARIVRKFLALPGEYEACRARFMACEIPGHPREIVRRVVALAGAS